MMQPLKVDAQVLHELGFSDDDVRNLSEIYSFMDSVNSLGSGSSFSNIASVLGNTRNMIARCNALNVGLEHIVNSRKKSGLEWAKVFGVGILDTDGWNGKFPKKLEDLITVEEFVKRASVSTCSGMSEKSGALFAFIEEMGKK
jgi:uncharacterized protein YfkK (UPF0435 family)